MHCHLNILELFGCIPSWNACTQLNVGLAVQIEKMASKQMGQPVIKRTWAPRAIIRFSRLNLLISVGEECLKKRAWVPDGYPSLLAPGGICPLCQTPLALPLDTDYTIYLDEATDFVTKGHCWKLKPKHSRLNRRASFFSVRVVSDWNTLPEYVVNSSCLNQFKVNLDYHLHAEKFAPWRIFVLKSSSVQVNDPMSTNLQYQNSKKNY